MSSFEEPSISQAPSPKQIRKAPSRLPDQSKVLADAGFEKLGDGWYYPGRLYVILKQGKAPEFFVPFVDSHRRGHIAGIKRGTHHNSPSLTFMLDQVIGGSWFTERTIVGGGETHFNFPNEIPPHANEFQGSIEQQLIEAGFTEDKSHESGISSSSTKVFRMEIPGKPSESIRALVSNGKLTDIFEPIDEHTRKHLTADTKIIGSSVGKDFFKKKKPLVKVSNTTMEFLVDPERPMGMLEGSQKLLREIRVDELGIVSFAPRMESSGFTIGGANSTDTIWRLESIGKLSIEQLEHRMRPDQDSDAGFLGSNEKLLEVMANDNDYVLAQNLTHQDLAEPLFYIEQLFRQGYIARDHASMFSFKGSRYRIEVDEYNGPQFSPFRDGTSTNLDVQIKNLTNGETMEASLLLPYMIQRYGFYEGKGTSYRLSPETIIKVFPFLREISERRKLGEAVEKRTRKKLGEQP